MTAALVILRGEFSDVAAYLLFAAAGWWTRGKVTKAWRREEKV